MTQRERREVTDKILEWCRREPETWAFKVHGDGTQGAGIPDIIGCRHGRFFAVEAKTTTGRVSKLQRHFLELIEGAGGVAIVARSLEEFTEAIETETE